MSKSDDYPKFNLDLIRFATCAADEENVQYLVDRSVGVNSFMSLLPKLLDNGEYGQARSVIAKIDRQALLLRAVLDNNNFKEFHEDIAPSLTVLIKVSEAAQNRLKAAEQIMEENQ